MQEANKTLSLEEFKVEQFTLDFRQVDPYAVIKGVSEKTVMISCGGDKSIFISSGSYGYSVSLYEKREFFSESGDAASFTRRVLDYVLSGGTNKDVAKMRETYENDKSS
jgi:hypothetical protein